MKRYSALILLLLVVSAAFVFAQAPDPAATRVQSTAALHALTPISTTVAVNNQATLTIPAPAAGQYNYICKLVFRVSQDGTATAANNVVTTSTNFNFFAFTVSAEDVAQKESEARMDFGNPATGCAKSTSPGTATTFVGPSAITNAGQYWGAAYFQAP
jgi:hypothetical protein